MAIIKCKMCGGDLNVIAGETIAECEYCGSKQTIPSVDNEKKLTLFSRANRLRFGCEFDKAAGVYEAIVADFPEEAEAYWGLVLCKYGIEYVDDPATGKKIPTCHRSSFDSVMDDSNLEQALENADAVARRLYRDEAKQIEEIRKGIIEVSGKEEPYDIFICYKETAEDGNRTLDSVLAQDVYDALTAKGYRVFFSRITLEDKLGQEYEPYIFAALNSASIMLALGTDYDYFNAVWVKNEWSRYLQLMTQDKTKHLIPCYKGIDAYDMPKEFAKLQAQDMGKVGAVQDLLRGIAKIIRGSADAKPTTTSATAGALTKRGYFFLEDGNFRSADEYFEKALDENPEDYKAYAGKVLASLHLKDIAEINNRLVKLYGDKNYERAIRFSSGTDKAQLEDIKENADRKWFVKCLTVALKKIAKKREDQEILDKIKELASAGTVDAYEKIVSICTDARRRHVSEAFNLSLIDSYKRQLDILRLLTSDYMEYTIEDMKRSKYFSHVYLNLNVLAGDVKRMVADGSVENGLAPNTYCIAGAVERRQQLKNEQEYARANMMAQNAEQTKNPTACLAAAKIFETLGSFADAQNKAAEYLALSNRLKREQEEEIARQQEERARQEELRRQELARQEAERKVAEAEQTRIRQEKQAKLSALQSQRAALGLFAFSQKKELDAKISALEAELRRL